MLIPFLFVCGVEPQLHKGGQGGERERERHGEEGRRNKNMWPTNESSRVPHRKMGERERVGGGDEDKIFSSRTSFDFFFSFLQQDKKKKRH